MDKLLAMCKIFKCSLDDLTNDEITDISIEERKKSNFNTFIDSILSFINQTYHIVRKMTGKEMTNDLYFLFQADEYIEDDAMNNQIKVEVDYYGDYVDIMLPPEIYSSMIGYVKSDNVIFKKLMNQIIQDLGNKKIYNYEKVREMNIKIYGSKENIQKLENNYEKEIHKINERNEDELEYYQNEIYRYELKIDELEEKINDLKHKIQELEHSNEEYKQKIEDYKVRLQSIITE